MRFNVSLTARILIIGVLVVIGIFFTAIVWAQGNPDDPEGGTTPPATPVAPGTADEVEMQLAPDLQAQEVTLFKSIAGSNFYPRETTTTHSYGGAGCIYRTSASGFFVSDLQLPKGAEIDFMRLYFDDTNASSEANLWLYSYDGQGGFTQIAHVSSSGTPGQSSVGSGFFSHVVDNTAESLGFVVGTDAADDSTVSICRVRLRYKVDIPGFQFLPAVLKQYIIGE